MLLELSWYYQSETIPWLNKAKYYFVVAGDGTIAG